MLGAAVIGLGVGAQHADFYVRREDCRLVSICESNSEKVSEIVGRYGNVKVANDFTALCEDADIDIISIASFDHHHAAQVLEGLKAGKNLFVEKPLCTTVEELQEIVAAWKRANSGGNSVYLASNLPLRKAPLFSWLRAEIASGALGEIYAIDGEYLYGRLSKITQGWRKDVDHYSVIEGGGIHLIDLMLFLTGQYPEKVWSMGNKIVTRDTAFRYNDYAVSTFKFKSGLIGRISANFGCVHPHQHILKVFGTRGTFILDDMGARIQRHRDPLENDNYRQRLEKPKADPVDFPAYPDSKAAPAADLIAAIRGDLKQPLTYHEFRLMSVCLAAAKAHDTGQPEAIEYMDE